MVATMRWTHCPAQRRRRIHDATDDDDVDNDDDRSETSTTKRIPLYRRLHNKRYKRNSRQLAGSRCPFLNTNALIFITFVLLKMSTTTTINAFAIIASNTQQQRPNDMCSHYKKSTFPLSLFTSPGRKHRSLRFLSQNSNTDYSQYNNSTTSQSSITITDLAASVVIDSVTSLQQPSVPAVPNAMNSVGFINGVTSKAGPLNEAVLTILHGKKNYTDYTLQDANELVTIGAVWAKMETLSSEEILSLYDTDNEDDARYLYADLPRGWGSGSESEFADEIKGTGSSDSNTEDDLDAYIHAMAEQRYRRILTPSSITAGIDLRIYPQPRRFVSCYDIQSRNLLYEDTTFIVVDKPPMLPTQPDASNYIECCPSCVNIQLGPFYDILGNAVQRPLLCHRIDTCVGGIVVLSKDSNGQRVFHQYQRERQLRKMYYAVTTQPVPIGQHIHWMWARQSARSANGGPPCQLVRHTPPDSRRIARTYWNRCVLEVVNCTPIDIDPDTLSSSNLSEQQQYYQSTIRLVTGRKHQVRAQLASLGCPIINDTLYGPIAGYTLDDLEQSEDEFEEQISKCRVPLQPIGLQAAGILFGGIKVRANTPWWG